jgi:hypothetical protein
MAQEGQAAHPSFTSPGSLRAGVLQQNGVAFVRGSNADLTQWVVGPGLILHQSGDEIVPGTGEQWSAFIPFNLVAPEGSHVIAGRTDLAFEFAAVYYPGTGGAIPQQVLLRAGTNTGSEVVLENGAPVRVQSLITEDGAVILSGNRLVAGVNLIDSANVTSKAIILIPF